MSLCNKHIPVLMVTLVTVTAALIYLGISTGPFSNISEADVYTVSQSSYVENYATVTDSGDGSVIPHDLEAEYSDIITKENRK